MVARSLTFAVLGINVLAAFVPWVEALPNPFIPQALHVRKQTLDGDRVRIITGTFKCIISILINRIKCQMMDSERFALPSLRLLLSWRSCDHISLLVKQQRMRYHLQLKHSFKYLKCIYLYRLSDYLFNSNTADDLKPSEFVLLYFCVFGDAITQSWKGYLLFFTHVGRYPHTCCVLCQI